MEKLKTGWERENRAHFDEIVTNYDKVRWGYPAALFADVVEYAGPGKKTALEIGAGTGKATTPFLDYGYRVTAVEMGAHMAEFLSEKFKGRTNFAVINKTFEDAALADNSYDIVYAASAFHWVDAEVGCPKVFRLLINKGVFALFRNNAVPPDEGELYEEIQAVYDKYYYNHYKLDKRAVKTSEMTSENFLEPAEIHRGFRFEGLERYGFQDITMKIYRATSMYGADEYVTLLDTYSDHRALPDKKRAALYTGVREAIMKHGGRHRLDFVYQLYLGRKL